MMPALLLTSAGLVLGLLGGAWAMRRRQRRGTIASADSATIAAPTPDDPPPACVADTDTGAGASSSGADDWVALATPAQVLQRLHAVAFAETAAGITLDEAGGHAEVVAAAEAVLARIESQPRYTPRRPQLLPQLMRAVNDADGSLRTIAGIIAQDPALAGNLLRIANSPLYRVRAEPIENVERAVTVLGTDGIRLIISAALVQPVMNTDDSAFGRLAATVWDHTLLASAAAADHATRVEREDAFAAQLLALLQGLASIIVVQVARDQYARQPRLVPDAAEVIALLDAWVDPTARRIAESWGLSERIEQALDPHRVAGAAGSKSALQADTPAGSVALGRSLRFGRLAGALALLARRGDVPGASALARLAQQQPAAPIGVIWQRVLAAG